MDNQKRKQLAENLLIKVGENPNEGACSISEHFREGWKTGIDVIDNIETSIDDNAPYDSITVVKKDTKEVVLEIKGQKALLLNILAEGLISYLEIKITRI